MQVSFHLRKDKKNKEGKYPVRVFISYDGNKIKYQLPEVRVTLSHWKEKDRRIKTNSKSEVYKSPIFFNTTINIIM